MKRLSIVALALMSIATPAHAEVKALAENGFAVVHGSVVTATPDQIWKRLIAPKDWWNPEHSWSGSTAGFSIDAKAGGCFCELFQQKDASGKLRTSGSVEHMRVLFADPGKVLRMSGALGPLQSEAVTGTLTVVIEGDKAGTQTKVSFSYVVGGFARYKMAAIAPNVDKVIGDQFARLLKPFADNAPQLPIEQAIEKAPEKAEAKPGAMELDLGEINAKAADEGGQKSDAPPPNA